MLRFEISLDEANERLEIKTFYPNILDPLITVVEDDSPGGWYRAVRDALDQVENEIFART